jgi:hypothetical protein
MFNLEQSIADWRRKMTAAGIKTPVPLNELEEHLREDVARQMQLGSAAELAFHKAAEGIGSGKKLAQEFARVRELKRIHTRKVLRRWSAVVGTAFVYCTLAMVWIIGVRQGTLVISWKEIVLAASAILPMIGFGWAGNALPKYLLVTHRGVSLIVAFGVIILGAASLRLFWGAITPANFVQTQIILLWSLSLLVGVGNCLSAWVDNSKRRELEISH